MSAPALDSIHRVLLTCKTCGHWKKGPLPYAEILDWLRVHHCAGLEDAPLLNLVRESSCPKPCGPISGDSGDET